MKKFLILLSFAITTAFLPMSAIAQITVTSTDVTISKPLTLNPTITSSANYLSIGFANNRCKIQIGNAMDHFSGLMAAPSSEGLSNVGRPSYMGYIMPEVTNFMDLGSDSNRFRNTYTKKQ